ncbi:hypothetical protein ACEVQ6_02815 [Ciceribacter sp. sgz301302]
MGRRLRGEKRLWRAIALACLLVFQAMAVGLAHAAGADRPVLDAFGNPLCSAGPAEGQPSSPPPHSPADCMALACGMGTSAVPPDRTAAKFPFPQSAAFLFVLSSPDRAIPSPTPDARETGQPRAPPFLS